MHPDALARVIVAEAGALGFHRVGIAPVEPARRHDRFEGWVASGYGGDMAYLADPAARAARRDVRALLPSARTVVVVALSYAGGAAGPVARYARGADYHMVLKEKLGALADRVAASCGRAVAARPCVDTAPVLERDLGERAGIGFIGKNTMLIAPGIGSYVLLGELLLDAEATPTGPEERERCGSCRLCLDACPTGAFVDAHTLDARRCISYLTIEHAGAIPRELRPKIGARIFGCDVCQEVCPFNAAEHEGAPELAGRDAPDLLALLDLGAAQFRRFVRRTALRRVHRAQLLRNVCVALGNVGDARAIPRLRACLVDERSALVRLHAAWALGRLGDRKFLAQRREAEVDSEVRAEIDVTLGVVDAAQLR
jgi:epoxyqueuosine reductase